MVSNHRSVLPPSLSGALRSLSESLERGPSPEALRRVLEDLGKLPVKVAVQGAREIADAAQLTWRVPAKKGWFGNLIWPSLSEKVLLRHDPDIAWLFLFHDDGRVREQALDAIQAAPTAAFFLVAIAWRLNDWAEPVRLAAVRCASRVFPHADPDVAASVGLYLLDRRLTWQRWREEQGTIDLIFMRQTVMERLATLLRGDSNGALAAGLRHALRYTSIDQHLPRLAREATHPAVRAVALRCLLERKATWPIGFEWQWIDKVYGRKKRRPVYANRAIQAPPRDLLLTEGLSDRSAVVRRVAADGLIADRSTIPNLDDILARLASDKSPSIRERADYMIRHPSR